MKPFLPFLGLLAAAVPVSASVEVEGFLCGTPGINGGRPPSGSYGMGDEFQICVVPTNPGFSMVGFRSVTCWSGSGGGSGYEQVLVGTSGELPQPFSEIRRSVEGARSLDGSRVAGPDAIAISVFATERFFPSDSEVVFRCTGDVELSSTTFEPEVVVMESFSVGSGGRG